MTNIFNIVKIIGAWGCLIAALVLVLLAHSLAGLPMLLGVLSIAFSQAPVA
jgi:hypothetical protein